MAVCAWCKVEHDPNEGHKTKDSKIADLQRQLREAQAQREVATGPPKHKANCPLAQAQREDE